MAGEIRLWNTDTGRLLLPPFGEACPYLRRWRSEPDEASESPRGTFTDFVRFWDTTTGKEVGQPLPQRDIVLGLAYSRDAQNARRSRWRRIAQEGQESASEDVADQPVRPRRSVAA